MATRYFNKQHLRNCLRTLKHFNKIKIIEDRSNSLGDEWTNRYYGKLIDYKITSYPENAFCVLTLTIKKITQTYTIDFDIPYDSVVHYGDILKNGSYIIDYIDSGPHQYLEFVKMY